MRATQSARGKAPTPPARPPQHAHAAGKSGGNGAQRPASARLALGFSLLRLSVPARLVVAAASACLLWLCIVWTLA